MKQDFLKKAAFLNDIHQKENQYWHKKMLSPLETNHFPYLDNSGGKDQVYSQAVVDFELNQEISQKLILMSNNSDARLHIILLAFSSILLMKYTGNSDLLIATVIYRQKTVGELINSILPLRLTINPMQSFKEIIILMKKTITEAIEHQNYPIELILKTASDGSNAQNVYQLDHFLILENIQDRESLPGMKSNLTMSFVRKDTKISAKFEYNQTVYSRTIISEIIKHFNVLLEKGFEDFNCCLNKVSMLTAAEEKLIANINDTKLSFLENETIISLFEDCAENNPELPALIFESTVITYEQLNNRINQMAHFMIENGIGPEVIVALVIQPSIEMIIGILAILKAGGTYLPIDPNSPKKRIEYILNDSNTGYLVSTKSTELTAFSGVCLNIDEEKILSYFEHNPVVKLKPENAAYIIYTSGSTGNPKGVVIEHRNVVRLFFHKKCRFDFSKSDVWPLFHSFGFDLSVWEIFGALLYGGILNIIPSLIKKDPKAFLDILRTEKATILTQTPSAFYQLVHEESQNPRADLCLRYVILGGESLIPSKIAVFKKKYPATRIINMYGITETTVHTTFKEITEQEISDSISNIGIPFSTVQLYIINNQSELLPIGVVGEMAVGGDGVARGYFNQPELTAQKFKSLTIANKTERVYLSGDLGRYLPNGDIEYIGRNDTQVKIRGFRIELDEIRTQIVNHKDIHDAVIIARKIDDSTKVLYAYLVLNEKDDFDPVFIRNYLKNHLNDYMIPSYIIPVSHIPLTINGKIDYEELLNLELKGEIKTQLILPVTELEKKIATVWCMILKQEKVGIHSTVFELGGTSFDLIKMSQQLTELLQQEISVVTLFTYPTISSLAQLLESETNTLVIESDKRSSSLEKGKQARLQKLKFIKSGQ